MTTKDFDYVLDGPPNFFGAGQSSKGCYTREGFFGMVKAYRELGKTVHVHEDHHPVFAVIEPKPAAPTCDIRKLHVLPSAAVVKVVS